MKLSNEERRALLWLSRQTRPMWGGIYDRRGQSGHAIDHEIERWIRDGLILGVPYPHKVGKSEFSGGYIITPAGRAALGASHDED